MCVLSRVLVDVQLRPFRGGNPRFVGNASFLLDELLDSVRPDNGPNQMSLVGSRIFLLDCLLSPTEMAR